MKRSSILYAEGACHWNENGRRMRAFRAGTFRVGTESCTVIRQEMGDE